MLVTWRIRKAKPVDSSSPRVSFCTDVKAKRKKKDSTKNPSNSHRFPTTLDTYHSPLHPRLPKPLRLPHILLTLIPTHLIPPIPTLNIPLPPRCRQPRYTVLTLSIPQPPETPLTPSIYRSGTRSRVRGSTVLSLVARVIPCFPREVGAAEQSGKGREAGADDADVELDGAEDDDGDCVPDIVLFAAEDDAEIEGDDGAEAGAVYWKKGERLASIIPDFCIEVSNPKLLIACRNACSFCKKIVE